MTEKDLYQSLKRALPYIWFTRIETGTQSGVPDISYCTPECIDGWIELKIGAPRLKPSQVAWHTKAIAWKRRAFILTAIPTGGFQLYRTDKFCPIDTKHFTPALASSILLRTKVLSDISYCLTRTY